MRLIFFDMDGVLTPKAHGIFLAEMIGKGDELRRIFHGTTNRRIGLEWVVREGAKLLTGVPESLLEKAGKTLHIVNGAKEAIKELKKSGYSPILITNGIEQVAEASQPKAAPVRATKPHAPGRVRVFRSTGTNKG